MAQPVDTREQDAAWASLAPQLDSTWERDWPATIALLDGFLQQWPTYAVAEDKLYAALIADSQVHVQAGQVDDGVTELERAARLLPDRPEAWALLAQMATEAKH
jgi:predicted Zn-dependent protease